MFYQLKDGVPVECTQGDVDAEQGKFIAVIEGGSAQEAVEHLGIGEYQRRSVEDGSHHLTGDGYDYMSLVITSVQDPEAKPERVSIYLNENMIVFIAKNTYFDFINRVIAKSGAKFEGCDNAMYAVFDALVMDDFKILQGIEAYIEELEDLLLNEKTEGIRQRVADIRRQLLALKRYYEQLLDVADDIRENANKLMSKKAVANFNIFAERVERIYRNVINLRDYSTQLREAYQAEIDIKLNNIMKVFTVVTSIFMPLNLITSWYGMNLRMPEFGWAFGYPMVMALCGLTGLGCYMLFKRNKWF